MAERTSRSVEVAIFEGIKAVRDVLSVVSLLALRILRGLLIVFGLLLKRRNLSEHVLRTIVIVTEVDRPESCFGVIKAPFLYRLHAIVVFLFEFLKLHLDLLAVAGAGALQ